MKKLFHESFYRDDTKIIVFIDLESIGSTENNANLNPICWACLSYNYSQIYCIFKTPYTYDYTVNLDSPE